MAQGMDVVEAKVVVLGDVMVGKSCLLYQFVHGSFNPNLGATIVDIMTKTIMVDGITYRFQIWDTAGRETYQSIVQTYYRNATAAIVVYDITEANTFQNLASWIKALQNYGPNDIVVAIAGNKSDLKHWRDVDKLKGEEFAEQNGAIFAETSALSASSVEGLFIEIGRRLTRLKHPMIGDNTEWQSAYEDSIRKHGSVSVQVTRSIFVGPSAVGKSSLKHLLVHNVPKAVKTSTAVIDTPEVVTKRSYMEFSCEQYAVEEGTSAWQPVNSDIMKNSLHACITSKAYEEKNQYPIEVKAEALLHQYPIEGGQREAFVEEQKDSCHLPKQDQSDIASLDKQYSQLLQKMGKEGMRIRLKDASFIHLLDTGGQPSFQDVLPLLLDVPCTYIQVFNASRSLYERLPITYRPNDHTELHLDGAENGRDMMLRSFSSMHTVARKCSKQLASFQLEGNPLPKLRIFVVGTHKDELIKLGRLDKATQDITTFLEALDGKPYFHSIEWNESKGQPFFLIDATADKDDKESVNHLRDRLSSEESALELDVPVMWFICQEVTRCTPKKFFRLKDLEAFCQKHGFVDGENAASQFRALLQLLSLLGFYSFFNLKGVPDKDNFVCTDAGVFLKEVSKLLAVQFVPPTSGWMRDFKNTGILIATPQLYQSLGMSPAMDPKWFLEALQHLGIAAHLPCKDGPERFFIPAVLPQSSENQNPTPSVAPLCLTYTTEEGAGFSRYSYLPQGVFCRLAVELIHQEWKIMAKESTRTLLLFRWMEFQVFLKESSGYIILIPQVVEEISTPSELHTKCVHLRHTISDCLSVSTEAVLGSNFNTAEWAVGFECPCKEVDMPHLAVPSVTGKALDCLETYRSQTYNNKQRIWFSSVDGVDGVELVKDAERRIWVIGEKLPVPQPKPLPPEPPPSPSGPTDGDDALSQEVTADAVLDNFRDLFIAHMDANTIVYGLEHANIIADGDLKRIERNPDATQQNEILHRCLKRSCDKKALVEVCGMMIAVRGNRKMNSLGNDMKCQLEKGP